MKLLIRLVAVALLFPAVARSSVQVGDANQPDGAAYNTYAEPYYPAHGPAAKLRQRIRIEIKDDASDTVKNTPQAVPATQSEERSGPQAPINLPS